MNCEELSKIFQDRYRGYSKEKIDFTVKDFYCFLCFPVITYYINRDIISIKLYTSKIKDEDFAFMIFSACLFYGHISTMN